jgi:hypothetical protein
MAAVSMGMTWAVVMVVMVVMTTTASSWHC